MTTQDMLRDLARPFPPKYVHTNPSGGGTYVKHHVVEQRLIQVLGLPPSFKMIEVLRGDVAAVAPNPNGRSQRAKDGSPALSGVVVGVIAQMVVHIGKETVSGTVIVQEAGDCEEPHNWKTDGARLKDAMSDAYKRCAMRLGCGLHLWSQDEYFLYDKLQEAGARLLSIVTESGEAEGTQEVTPPSGGTSRPGAVPAPSAPPTTHLGTAETTAMDRSAKGWVHELVRQYGDERVAEAAKAVAPELSRKPNSFKSLESWSVPDLMIVAEHLAKPSDVAGSVSGTDAGGKPPIPTPGTPPEQSLDLIDRAKEAGLIRFSDIAKHSSVFLKAGGATPTTWSQLASCAPEVLAELVDVLGLRERVDPKQGSLT